MPDDILTIIYDNPIDDAEILTASSQVPTMPVDVLRSTYRHEVFRTLSCSAQWIKAKFSRPVRADNISFVNYNHTSSASVRLQLNSIDNFDGTVLLDQIFPLKTFLYGFGRQPFGRYGFGGTSGPGNASVVTRPISPPLTLFFDAPTAPALWALISIDDPLNTDGYLQYGRIYTSKSLTFSVNYQWGSEVECIDLSKIYTTEEEIIWVDRRPKIFQRTLNLGKLTSKERFYDLMDFWLAVGCADPFILILDPSTDEMMRLTSHYCRLVEDPKIQDAFVNQHDIVLKIREVR